MDQQEDKKDIPVSLYQADKLPVHKRIGKDGMTYRQRYYHAHKDDPVFQEYNRRIRRESYQRNREAEIIRNSIRHLLTKAADESVG